MGRVLVLNATYEPLSVVSIKRAIILLLKEKAELVEATETVIRSERLNLPVPVVIRLRYYVKVPRPASWPVTRRGVLARDDDTCQYCGQSLPRPELTIDHVVARSRGGLTVWENVVTACQQCNIRKGSRTPAEANMPLMNEPKRPSHFAFITLAGGELRQVWDKYMFS